MSEPAPQPEAFRRTLGRVVSLTAIVLAVVLGWTVLHHQRVNPRTDDAQIRANMIGVAPQVGGTIIRLAVVDNQAVKRGDLLFEIDPRPYTAEVERAEAQLRLTELEIRADVDDVSASEAGLKNREARAVYAESYHRRVASLLEKKFVTADKVELARTEAESARAQVEEARAALTRAQSLVGDKDGVNVRKAAAEAALREAKLKLDYCKVYAPCDGYVTNLQITPGAYAAAGQPIFSLIDRRTWYVLANFRETEIRDIKVGMPVDIYLLAEGGRKLRGYVQGVARGIYPLRDPTTVLPGSEGVLTRSQPTIDFILLAQRYPVRILLEEIDAADFRIGGTAVATIRTTEGTAEGERILQQRQQVDLQPYEAPAP